MIFRSMLFREHVFFGRMFFRGHVFSGGRFFAGVSFQASALTLALAGPGRSAGPGHPDPWLASLGLEFFGATAPPLQCNIQTIAKETHHHHWHWQSCWELRQKGGGNPLAHHCSVDRTLFPHYKGAKKKYALMPFPRLWSRLPLATISGPVGPGCYPFGTCRGLRVH